MVDPVIQGCWQLSSGHSGNGQSEAAVLDLLMDRARAGYCTFDCADIYLGVEELLASVRQRLEPEGIEIRVHTKLVPDLTSLADFGESQVQAAIDSSLRRQRVDRLDLVQFHWWDFEVPGYVEAAQALVAQRDAGKIREIGVTNFGTRELAQLLDAGVPIVSNQVQYSLLDRRPERSLVDLARTRDVRLLAYGSLAGGFLSDSWLGREDPKLETLANRSLVKYRLIVEEVGGWTTFQGLLATLATVASRHEVDIATLSSRWVLEREAVAAVIIGVSPRHDLEGDRLLGLHLSDDDRGDIESALASLRRVPGELYELERDRSGAHGSIMKYDLNQSRTSSGS